MLTNTRKGITAGLAAALLASSALGQVKLAPPRHEAGSKFGWSVAGVPDVNGDGRGDLIVSAEAESVGNRADAGRVYLVNGANGGILRVILPPTVQMIGTFGWTVAGIPDVTGDGRGDVLVGGIWETDPQGRLCGRAYLYSGATGQRVRAWLPGRRQDNGCFGWSMNWVPDTNGDGTPDIIIGTPFEDVGGRAGAGRVYVYSGSTGQYLRTLWSPVYQIQGNFGYSVAGIADVNGDGRGDIIVGAPGEKSGASPSGAGRVYVFSGATGSLIRAHRSATEVGNGNFGFAVAAVGDSNDDGREDVMVGAPHEISALKHLSGGRVHLFSGATGVGLRRMSSPGAQIQGNFGSAVGAIQNDDGTPTNQMIIGAPEELSGVGRAYVIGPPGMPIRPLMSPFPTINGKYGAAVGGVPDTDGDGSGDVAIGANSESGFGRAYIYR
jgi:hypothetical protein